MKIKEVRAVEVDLTVTPKTPPREPSTAPSPTEFTDRSLSLNPFRTWKWVACVVTADDGAWGLGISHYGGPVARIINDQFAPNLVGENCMATEKLWDMMYRMTRAYGTAGLASYAISAVDLALWDLKGKLLKRPVYELLGGPQKDKIFCYASNNNPTATLENSIQWAMELGFKATKVFLNHSLNNNIDVLRKEEEMVARARELVGDDVELMVDAYMTLDEEYTVRLAEALRPYRIKWLEDYILPENLEGYARVRKRLPWQTLATGEHWYTPLPFMAAASRGMVDIFQPDVKWVGGITASVRICHIAEAAGLSVITHGGMNYPYGQHLAFAMPAIPMGERSEGFSAPGVPLEEMVRLPGTAVIKDGYVVPSDAPGFGLEVSMEWLESAASR